MVELRFTVTEESLETVEPPEATSWGVIATTVFENPIYFVINGVNILGHHDGGTENLSIVGFAVDLVETLDRLQQVGGCQKTFIANAGWLYMEESKGNVKIWTTTFRPNVEVPLAEAAAAFRAFKNEVQRVIESRLPSIKRHPQWPLWFPTQPTNPPTR